jgi:hypothetical protein
MIKYEKASDFHAKMKNERSKDRPTCGDLLADKHLWSLSEIEFDFENELELITKISDSVDRSYLISIVKHRHRYNLDRGAKIIGNFRMYLNEKRDLIRNIFSSNEVLKFFQNIKSKHHEKPENFRCVIKDAYNCPMILKIFLLLFLSASSVDYIYSEGIHFAHIFATLFASPLILSAFYFDLLITCLLILKNQTISTIIFERRYRNVLVISTLVICGLLVVTMILALIILRVFFAGALIMAIIILLAIIYDLLFFNRSIFNILNRRFGEYVLCFFILLVCIFFILILVAHISDKSIVNCPFIEKLTTDISKFVLYFCIFYVLNFWFFMFIETIYNNPILNCRNFSYSYYDDYFIICIRLVISIFLFIIIVSALISDFFFIYAFVISVIIIWSIFSDALIHHRSFNKEFVICYDRYILSFCVFSFLNYSILFFYAIIFDNPVLDRSFVFSFNPSFGLFEYSFLILFIVIFWFLKLVDHFTKNLILNRRIIIGFSEFVISSCLFSIITCCIPNSIIPVSDETVLNQRVISMLIFGIDKFILVFCMLNIFVYIIVISIRVFLNRFRTIDCQFFGTLFTSFTKLLILFCALSIIIPKIPVLNTRILGFLNTIIFISILLGLKYHFKKFTFGYLIKPASLFGVLIIGLLIFGNNNFVSFLSNYSFLIIYSFFIIANYS